MTQLNESKFIKIVYNVHVLIVVVGVVDSSRSSSSSKCACNIQPINVSFSDTHHTLKIETKYSENAQSGFVRSLLLSIHPSIHPLFYFISILFVCFAYAHTHSAISLVAAAAAPPSTRRTYPHNAKYTCENSKRPKNGIHIEKRWFWFFSSSSWNVFYLENTPNVLSRRRSRTKEITTSEMRGKKEQNKIKWNIVRLFGICARATRQHYVCVWLFHCCFCTNLVRAVRAYIHFNLFICLCTQHFLSHLFSRFVWCAQRKRKISNEIRLDVCALFLFANSRCTNTIICGHCRCRRRDRRCRNANDG